MNHAVFDRIDTDLRPASGETAQDYMERLFSAACADSPGEGRINDLLRPRFVACDADARTLTVDYPPRDWTLNSKSTLHGGMMSTMLDMTMGLLGRYCKGVQDVTTVTLDVRFLRPAPAGRTVRVCAQAEKTGHRILFLRAGLSDAETGEQFASAGATFL